MQINTHSGCSCLDDYMQHFALKNCVDDCLPCPLEDRVVSLRSRILLVVILHIDKLESGLWLQRLLIMDSMNLAIANDMMTIEPSALVTSG